MNTYLDGRAAPERRFSRFLVFGAGGRSGASARSPPDCSTCRSRTAPSTRRSRTGNARSLEPIPAPRGLDLRSKRVGCSSRTSHVRCQGPTRRPAGRPARRGGGPPRRAARRWTPPRSTPPSTATRVRRSTWCGSPRTSIGDGATDLRSRLRAARHRSRGRGPPCIHGRPADVASARLHGPGVGGGARPTSAIRATNRTTCSGRSGLEAQYETELRGTYGVRDRGAGRDGPSDAGPPDRRGAPSRGRRSR